MSDIKWGTIVPLVGGMTIATENVLGTKPEVLLSYSAFGGNDQYAANYFNTVPYVNLDNETYTSTLDLVNTVCPCAGLSMLNASSTNRGSDSPTNDWMYKSAEYVLSTLKPKVFFGENAPGLYTKMGEGVVEKLRDISKKYGYSLSLYKTNSTKHGIPQSRIRTYYFFWKGGAPVLPNVNNDYIDLTTYLNQIPENSLYHDVEDQTNLLQDNEIWKFLLHKFETRENINNYFLSKISNKKSVADLYGTIINNPQLRSELLSFLHVEKNDRLIHKVNRSIKKVDDGKGFWGFGVYLPTDKTNAIISKNRGGLIHPIDDRFLTLREHMHLMGLPNDFALEGTTRKEVKNENVICQNVPVTTSEDMVKFAKSYIDGDLKPTIYSFIKQNNTNCKLDIYE